MKLALLLSLVLAAGEDPAVAPLAPARAEVTLRGPNPSYVGQMVQVEVELLRDDRQQDKSAPFFPEIRVRDAIALLAQTAPPPEDRVVDGVSFLVQKRIYLIFPQVPGPFTVPSIDVSIADEDGPPLSVVTQPLTLRADTPKGAGTRLPLVARDVKLTRHVAGKLDQLRVGDAFTVSLQLSAVDTDPVVLPELLLPEIPGLSRYAGSSRSSARSDRGEFHAVRSESATYVARDFGFYQLPRSSVFWLDPSTGRYHEAAVSPLSFRARVNPHLGTGCVGGPAAAARWGGSLSAVVLLAILGTRQVRRWSVRRAERARVKKTAAERAAFEALRDAAQSGSDPATLTALYRWVRCAAPQALSLEAWLSGTADSALHRAADELEQRVAGMHQRGLPTDIVQPVAQYRSGRKESSGRAARLPGLNELTRQ